MVPHGPQTLNTWFSMVLTGFLMAPDSHHMVSDGPNMLPDGPWWSQPMLPDSPNMVPTWSLVVLSSFRMVLIWFFMVPTLFLILVLTAAPCITTKRTRPICISVTISKPLYNITGLHKMAATISTVLHAASLLFFLVCI